MVETGTTSDADANRSSETGFANNAQICGMVRPIATMGEAYPETHWLEVHELVAEAAKDAGYRLRLVSESDQVGIIVSEIIRNLNENPIVVVDVSGRNPNVMFELGMRVTFQKPVVIITDDYTPFTFDIQAIRHVTYRRDLRTAPTRRFQKELSAAINATVEAASKPGYKGYLQQFGRIEVTGLADQSISLDELAQAVQDLKQEVRSSIARQVLAAPSSIGRHAPTEQRGHTFRVPDEDVEGMRRILAMHKVAATQQLLLDGSVLFSLPGISLPTLNSIVQRAGEEGVEVSFDWTL